MRAPTDTTGQPGCLDAPSQSSADAEHLVGGDLLTVARPTEDDAEAALVRAHAGRRAQHRDGVVVVGVEPLRAVVDDVVTALEQVLHQVDLEVEGGVVAADVHAHGASLAPV